jgi:hypothetical protein
MRVWNLLRAQVSLTNPANETGAELYMLVVFVYHYNIGQSSLGLGARFSGFFLLALRLGRENKSMQIFFFFLPLEQKTH